MQNLHDFKKLSPDIQKILNPFGQVYFSQFGEDVVIREYMKLGFLPIKGRFIDIGCYHPIMWSNTFLLYMYGWRGINIDANENMIKMQNQIRNEDLNICTGIAAEEGEHTFYSIGLQAASTIVPEHMEKQLQRGAPLNSEKTISCRPIMSVLKEHITEKDRESYSYVNIDLEGMDEIVVQQIDWEWLPVKLITVEIHDLQLSHVAEHPVHKVLSEAGFVLEHFIRPTAFYARRG
jgi:hypothetical protein